jgi:hypothetical protein
MVILSPLQTAADPGDIRAAAQGGQVRSGSAWVEARSGRSPSNIHRFVRHAVSSPVNRRSCFVCRAGHIDVLQLLGESFHCAYP